MRKFVLWLALGFAALTGAAYWGASRASGFTADTLLAVFSALLGVTLALVLVNFFVDQRSRRIAAAPLARLVSRPIATFHNEFISYGRERFGTAQFNSLLDTYQENKRDPVALAPDQRHGMSAIVDANLETIVKRVNDIDARMSDLINVLGWSFDAKIISASLNCKQNIAEFLANIDPKDDIQRLKRIEMYLDIDAAAGSALQRLYGVLGRQLEVGDQLPRS